MNVVVKWVFSFSVRIVKSKENFITVGVVDRIKQQEEPHSILSGNAVCYYGVEGGSMHYGEDGQCKQKETGDELCEGMEVKVAIDGFRVTFTLTHPNKKTKTHSITSDILGQSHR
jgi:NAD dependent epimerase/dehydratase family enzyme